ncbi:rod shape-determining protein [Geomonas nitrogeniifigens]|uniref:rod shape-determining protein n=1 Tax=Geomonas diazotrophica TaxID=2843197 RepID=UPI001C2BCFDF|nr:rod shape-determining protein [Geomonas nitrogeniifigens]QXE87007.1 rod shape-determining protein [Geomonas nitrogeniifigens]
MTIFNMDQWRQHVALDVGTATTRIATGSCGMLELPSRIGSRIALRDGVIVDPDAAFRILQPVIERRRVFGMVKPSILGCAPSDATAEERQLLMDSIMKAGAAAVSIIPEPLAAAVGANLDVSSPYAQMVVDVGDGVTDCAVLRSGKVVASYAFRGGCCRMRQAVVTAVESVQKTVLHEEEADLLLRGCGTSRPEEHAAGATAAAALVPVLEEIADGIDSFIRDLPNDIGCDVIYSGICLTGGGALIPGLRRLLEERTGVGVCTAVNPRGAVVEGARAILPVVVMLNRWK